jgi:type I restriction enzyme M protein
MTNHNEISSFIWTVCDDVLRGLFQQHEYGDVILPFLVMRRLDCVLEGKKDEIIRVHQEYRDKFDDTSRIIHTKLDLKFSNYSRYDLKRLKNEPNKLSENFLDYLGSFSSNVRDIIQNFGVQRQIDKLDSNNKLRYANLAARLIVKDLTKFFETKDDLLTLSLGSRSDFFSRQI